MSGSNRLAALAAALGVISTALTVAGCQRGSGQAAVSAARQSTSQAAEHPRFDGAAAMELLRTQCAFGPRVPGTGAHRRTCDWMIAEMEKYADKVVPQEFKYHGLSLTNVIGFFNTKASRQVLLCAHWDSRPTADMEISPLKRRLPIPGANDGASGVAVLLQLARMLKSQPPKVGVVIALLDGEDYGDFERDEGVFLGSRYFASNIRKLCAPKYGILLDMVGDRDLCIYREGTSEQRAGRINDLVFGIAGELGYGKYFRNTVRYTITDDHIPINDAGVPCIDLIDFDYAPWHTLDDTPDKCSAESLRIVGEVVAAVIYREDGK